MNKRILFIAIALALASAAQQKDISGIISKEERVKIAIPDFGGPGGSEKVMDAFNQTLFSDIQDSGLFEMAGKSFYPLVAPHQPSVFHPPTPGPAPPRRAPWLTDWSE